MSEQLTPRPASVRETLPPERSNAREAVVARRLLWRIATGGTDRRVKRLAGSTWPSLLGAIEGAGNAIAAQPHREAEIVASVYEELRDFHELADDAGESREWVPAMLGLLGALLDNWARPIPGGDAA